MQIAKRIHPLFQLTCAVICSLSSYAQREIPTPQRIELIQTDLFTVKDWRSIQVSVMGFYLGMSWEDALAVSRTKGLHLMAQGIPGLEHDCVGKDRCYLLDSARLFTGIVMTFGEKETIVKLSVEKVFEGGGSPAIEQNQVSRHFKGETFNLFNRYSRSTRLKLLGPEESKQSDRRDGRTTFLYPRTGVALTLDGCSEKPLEDPCSDLTVSFVSPARK